jgi:hypothetical protein
MFDDLVSYYQENVVASFLIYRDTNNNGVAGKNRDLREALNATTALFHFREHLPRAPTRKAIERLCSDYGLLADVANVSKHKSIDKETSHGAPYVSKATDLVETIDDIEYEDEIGTYRYVQKNVLVKLKKGSNRNLLEVLTNVINFWERYLHNLGILNEARTFNFDGYIRFRTRAECELNKLDFEMVQGHRFHQSLQFLRFNNQTGLADIVDFKGAKLELHLTPLNPQYNLVICLTNKNTGKEFKKIITLTKEENERYSLLSNNSERQNYLDNLSTAKIALKDIEIEAGVKKRVQNKVGRNVQCQCGSGKKYKNCCG